MRDWDGNCYRCGVASYVHTMSYFNTDLICPKCDDAEKAYPDYKQAVDAEQAEVMKGNMNYPGIGLARERGSMLMQ